MIFSKVLLGSSKPKGTNYCKRADILNNEQGNMGWNHKLRTNGWKWVFWVDYVPRQLHLNNILFNGPSPKRMEAPSCGARGKGSTLTLVTLCLWRKRPKSWVRIRAIHLRDEPLVDSCLTHKDYFAVINLSKRRMFSHKESQVGCNKGFVPPLPKSKLRKKSPLENNVGS
jgi:hypothetical protein